MPEIALWKERFAKAYQERGKDPERFQYVRLKKLPTFDFAKRPAALKANESLQFSDGYFVKGFKQSPLVILPLSEALLPYGIVLKRHFQHALAKEKDPFALLNFAEHGEGLFLYVPPDTTARLSLQESGTDGWGAPHVEIHLGKRAKLQIDQKQSSSLKSNRYLFISIDEEAECTWREEGTLPSEAVRLSSFRVFLKKNSRYYHFSYATGGTLERTSIEVDLLEEGGEAHLKKITSLDGASEHHLHTLISHRAPHTKSNQHFRSILQGESRSSFSGKIYVESQAQKTQSYQLHKTLLLSEKATVYSKPNLEIFADDVKASHGSTVGAIDQEALFYLISRGIPLLQAKQMLVEGFTRELSECLI